MTIRFRTSFLLREFFILVLPPADNDTGECRGHSEGGRKDRDTATPGCVKMAQALAVHENDTGKSACVTTPFAKIGSSYRKNRR